VGIGSIYNRLLVPLGSRDEARRILEEVWGGAAVEKLEPSSLDASRVVPGPFPARPDTGDPT
jgi:hypothetical protein